MLNDCFIDLGFVLLCEVPVYLITLDLLMTLWASCWPTRTETLLQNIFETIKMSWMIATRDLDLDVRLAVLNLIPTVDTDSPFTDTEVGVLDLS
jgi:hypothetical protein